MMNLSIEQIELLLLIAAVVAMLARRIQLPYTVGLVLAGVAISFIPACPNIELSKELLFSAFLPPLIFEAALYMHWGELRRDLPVILVLATLGVLLAAGLTAVGMHFAAGWEWTAALLFGILIAATDPISVIATFKEAGVRGRLRLLVEAESLFNDGTAAVAFAVVLAAAASGQSSAGGILVSFIMNIFGGVLCGALVAGFVLLLVWKTNDHLVEITFTTIAAYGSFLLAEHFHLSGVLATLTAGIIVGNVGPLGVLSDKGREAVESFWEYVAFVVNSLVFLLIGMHEAQQHFFQNSIPSIAAIALVLVARMVTVYSCCGLFARSTLRVEMRHQHILFWGGLRGALALALVLGLPPTFPHREALISVTFAVVAFSVIVQGITMTPLLRRMGILRDQEAVEQEAGKPEK